MIKAVKNILKYILPTSMKNLIRKVKNARMVYFGPLTYNYDGLSTRNNCDFMKDDLFMESYRLGKETRSWGDLEIPWRVHVVLWAASMAKNLNGDFVECGVNKGGFARAIMNYVDFKGSV